LMNFLNFHLFRGRFGFSFSESFPICRFVLYYLYGDLVSEVYPRR